MPMFSIVNATLAEDGDTYRPEVTHYAASRADLARFVGDINGGALVFRGKPIKVTFVQPQTAVRVVLGEPKAPKEKKARKPRAPKVTPTTEQVRTDEPAPFQGGTEQPARKKGGWPKGKPRKSKVAQESTANGAE